MSSCCRNLILQFFSVSLKSYFLPTSEEISLFDSDSDGNSLFFRYFWWRPPESFLVFRYRQFVSGQFLEQVVETVWNIHRNTRLEKVEMFFTGNRTSLFLHSLISIFLRLLTWQQWYFNHSIFPLFRISLLYSSDGRWIQRESWRQERSWAVVRSQEDPGPKATNQRITRVTAT